MPIEPESEAPESPEGFEETGEPAEAAPPNTDQRLLARR